MPRYYEDFSPLVADQVEWTLPATLYRQATERGDHTFLEAPAEEISLTFSEVRDRAVRIGSGLIADGLEQGDRVVIMAPNCSDYVLAWFGSSCAGMAEVPLNTAYAGPFLEHQIRTTTPRAVVLTAEFADRFLDGCDAYSSIEWFYLLDEAGDGPTAARIREAGFQVDGFDRLLSADRVDLPVVDYRDLAGIFFTSGTTGLSKGVMMSHSHLFFFSDQGRAMTRFGPDDTYMSVGPLFHGNAQFLAAYPALLAGGRFVLHEKFSASRWINQIRDCGATVTNLVGVMMDFVWKQPERIDDADNRLRCIYAVPTATNILAGFKERFGIEAFIESFGSTEASLPVISPYGENRPAGAAGLLLADWFEVRIVDSETDLEVPDGEVGELLVRSHVPWTMLSGYYGMPDKTVEALRNQWFHTGDAVRRDGDGWYFFVDRLKDAIRRRGENISSFEVEQALLPHSEIVDCAAVADKNGVEGGEDEVAIFVVLKPGSALTGEELGAWCEKQLPAFARPNRIEVIDGLPYTPSGKVRKRELRNLLSASEEAKIVR
jgi:crotonobetaine/carnitine-CoA ligase